MKRLFGNKRSAKEKESAENKSEKNINVSSLVEQSNVRGLNDRNIIHSSSASTLSTSYTRTTEERVIRTFKIESNSIIGSSSSNTSVSSQQFLGSSNNFSRDLTRHSINVPSISRDAIPIQTYREAKNYSASPRTAFSSQPISNFRSIPVQQTTSTFAIPTVSNETRTIPTSRSVSTGAIPKKQAEENNNVNLPVKIVEKLNITVKGSTRWYDNLDGKVPCYRTRSNKIVLLININDFPHHEEKERKGSEIDERNVQSLFTQMGFKVEAPKRKQWSKKDVETTIFNFKSSRGLKKNDICIVVIMSHGSGGIRSDSTVIACSNKEIIETSWIVTQFDGYNCKDLLGKPKIFIFQCCRGKQEFVRRKVKTDGISEGAVSPQSDILIAYATVPGFVSYRYDDIGSWYIHTLCKIFMEHACDTHVEDLLKMVDEEIKHFSMYHEDLNKPTTTYESRGFKKCYLHPKMS